MTRIDFYTEAPDKAEIACRLAAKAMQQQCRVLIFSPEDEMLGRVDRLLWALPPTSFVPHCRARAPIAPETPILLTERAEDPPHDDVLINLAPHWPSSFARFRRVIEIVATGDDDKQLARERFRFYRDRGYDIRTHRLGEE